MKISLTLSAYLARQYILNLLVLLAGLMVLIYFLDTLELLRRASKFDNVPMSLVLQMGLFKLPEVSQTLLPFAILFSAIYTFWNLTQKLELIIVRASGFSAFHFLAPVLIVSLAIGVLHISVIQPLSALMITQYEKLEAIHLKRKNSNIRLFKNGLWIKQDTDQGYTIFHSEKISSLDWKLVNVTGLFFDNQNKLTMRLDAPNARLQKNKWQFDTATIHSGHNKKSNQLNFNVPTKLTPEDIEDSFASQQTIPFWQMSSHIKILENSGFDTSKLKVHHQALLAQPILFAAMALIAAGVSMRLPRSGSALLFISAGLFIGLLLYFISSFMQALGVSQQIPIALSAWSTALISLLLGSALLLHLEEK